MTPELQKIAISILERHACDAETPASGEFLVPAFKQAEADACRATIECVNACAGMADPAAEIESLQTAEGDLIRLRLGIGAGFLSGETPADDADALRLLAAKMDRDISKIEKLREVQSAAKEFVIQEIRVETALQSAKSIEDPDYTEASDARSDAFEGLSAAIARAEGKEAQ